MKGPVEILTGGVKLFALIKVTYPAGCKLTCTKDGTILTAETSDGDWLFSVPEAGKWTVTATDPNDSTKSKSQDVEITAEGQVESVTLSFELILFDSGTTADLVGGWEGDGHAWNGTTATYDGGYMAIGSTISVTGNTGGSSKYTKSWTLLTKNKIDLTGYSTLKAVITGCAGSDVRLCVLNDHSNGFGGFGSGDPVASIAITGAGEISLLLGTLNAAYRLGLFIANAGYATAAASKLWLA